MYALVDYDPDGLSIFRTYQLGSFSLLHEEDTTAPRLRWLGIRSDHILPSIQSPEYSASPQSSQETTSSSQDSAVFSAAGASIAGRSDEELSQSHRSKRSAHARNGRLEALSQLTSRDRRMATNILRGICQEQGDGNVDEMEQARELQMMLMLNIKAEIQAVDNLGDITHWLDEKLCT
jgi:meiotic recombination protein SPO11